MKSKCINIYMYISCEINHQIYQVQVFCASITYAVNNNWWCKYDKYENQRREMINVFSKAWKAHFDIIDYD